MNRQDASSQPAARTPRMNSPARSRIDPNPKKIDDLISPDHKARLIWELVLGLDMAPLYQQIKAVEGHPVALGIPQRIHDARRRRGMTRYQVGQIADVPSTVVRAIEQGDDVPFSEFHAVATALGLAIELVEQVS